MTDLADLIDRRADWQWNVHTWSKQDNPSAALRHHLAFRLTGAPDAERRALAWLCYGQRYDPAVVDAYRRYGAEHGEDALFTAVLKARGDCLADFDEASVHLEWQTHSDPYSLAAADAAWRGGDRVVEAMFSLLGGQAHNGRAAQLYRACLAEDPERLFTAVRAHVERFTANSHSHPYLEGAGPDAHSLRDEVPTAKDAPA